jgi:hypothetical protein
MLGKRSHLVAFRKRTTYLKLFPREIAKEMGFWLA